MKRNRFLPGYAWFLLLAVPVWTQVLYLGARFLNTGRFHYDFSCGLDHCISVVPWTAGIYWGCCFFWITNYILSAKSGKQNVYRFFCADFMAKAICFACFILFPTTIDRPVIEGYSFWAGLLRLIYQTDTPDNLFPSIHCLVSWFSYIGVRGRKDIPLWYQNLSLVMALAVFASTLTTRQHVIVDIPGGLLLAEGCYWLAGRRSLLERYTNFIDGIFRRFQRAVSI